MPRLPPDPTGMFEAVRRMGYGFAEALADIVDNSIDAGAANVLIRFVIEHGRVTSILIADNGSGMSSEKLSDAMTFGLATGKGDNLLGKYGLGLKAASFSQAGALSVLTRCAGKNSGLRWTEDGIRRGWSCDEMAPEELLDLKTIAWEPLAKTGNGTIVRWESPLRFVGVADGQLGGVIDACIVELQRHLGLVMHRFLAGTNPLEITVQVMEDGDVVSDTATDPLDPFDYPHSGHEAYPQTLTCCLDGLGEVGLDLHIWPANSHAPGYRLGGGSVAQRQGFYFYRNRRLIQSGGWNDWRNASEPHLSLARVKVDLPPSLDTAFSLNTQKHGVHPPTQFFEGLKKARHESTTMSSYVADAERVYRAKPTQGRSGTTPCVPAGGMAHSLLEILERELAPGGVADKVKIRWARLPEDQFFAIDHDRIELSINNRARNSRSTSSQHEMTQLERVLLFLILQDDFSRQRHTRQSTRRLQMLQEVLMEAAKLDA
jgi:hypothetical protein